MTVFISPRCCFKYTFHNIFYNTYNPLGLKHSTLESIPKDIGKPSKINPRIIPPNPAAAFRAVNSEFW